MNATGSAFILTCRAEVCYDAVSLLLRERGKYNQMFPKDPK